MSNKRGWADIFRIFENSNSKQTKPSQKKKQQQPNKEHTHLCWSHILVYFFFHSYTRIDEILILQLYYVWLMNAKVSYELASIHSIKLYSFFFAPKPYFKLIITHTHSAHTYEHFDLFSKIKYYIVYCCCCWWCCQYLLQL